MQVDKSTYYDWSQRPLKIISAETLYLYRQAKTLFKASGEIIGSRELVKKLRKKDIVIGRYCMCTVMRKLKLKVKHRIAYKVMTKRKHSDQVADNLLN
ncbi:MAG: putative transposase [Congregibacter sp.]|jgi:putative transposase